MAEVDGARELAMREIAAVNAAMAEGCGLGFCSTKPSAIRVAARQLGVDRNGFRERVGTPDVPGRHYHRFGLAPDWSLAAKADPIIVPEAPRAKPEPVAAPYVWTRPRVAPAPRDGETMRILGIGDVHAKPGRSTETMLLAGRHAAATRPDGYVQIGDWLSLDSCSAHEVKGSKRDAKRPSFTEDLEAGEDSLDAFHRYAPDGVHQTLTLGNHCHRAWRWADAEPHVAGDLPLRIEQLFARYRWQTHAYGKIVKIGGVGFCHVPINFVGKPYGGKHSENTIANDLTFPLVWGHDHRFRFKQVPKIGDDNRIGVCNLGTAMPWGVVEDYTTGTAGWTYGIVDLTIRDCQLVGARFYDVLELREMYS
jgi:hypothetical protein